MSRHKFKKQIVESYSLNELKDLCFDLDINYDDLPGDRLSTKIEALLVETYRQENFADLTEQLNKDRPQRDWPSGEEVQDFAWADLAEKVDRYVIYITSDAPPLDLNLRRRLIDIIRRNWVDGYLNASVNRAINLSFQNEAGLVSDPSRPWDRVYKVDDKPSQPVPTDTGLMDLFDESGRALLILGEPGSGKTITLLQLCEALLDIASAEIKAKIPIVFNLSSWGGQQKPLEDWLVDEATKYTLSKKFMRDDMIKAERIILLLDGLDEVAESQRDACVNAINRFRENYNIPIAVCSRANEFEALNAKLNLGGALRIDPLDQNQIDQFLAAEGEPLSWLRDRMKSDPDLQTLGQSPLLLSLMPIAYRGESAADLDNSSGIEDQRKKLFYHFINKVFVQRPLAKNLGYTQQDSLSWLSFFALMMQGQQQTQFFIEFLDEASIHNLPLKQKRNVRSQLFLSLLYGFLFTFPFWAISFPIVWTFWGPDGPTLLSAILGSFFGVIFGIAFSLINGLVIGVISILNNYRAEQDLVEVVKIGWPTIESIKSGIRKSFTFVLIPFILSLLLAIANLDVSDLLSFIGRYFLLGACLTVLLSFLKIQKVSSKDRIQPNQGIYNSFRSTVLYTLILTFALSIFFQLTFQVPASDLFIGLPAIGFAIGLLYGPLLGVIFGGGLAVIQHYSVRRYLARNGGAPFKWPWQDHKLTLFLDEMSDRFLLYRIGGGWVFTHRYLLEYFADEWAKHKEST